MLRAFTGLLATLRISSTPFSVVPLAKPPSTTTTIIPSGIFIAARFSSSSTLTHTIQIRTLTHSHSSLNLNVKQQQVKMGAPGAVHHKVDTGKRLEALRHLMQNTENDVTAYVIPTDDQRAFSYRERDLEACC